MEIVLIKALQLICCLSLLVFLHEGGHFGFARIFKIRVEKFYLFFNPWFHLFSTKDKWFTRIFPKFKDKETEYGIGWVPLGGYVSIGGMVDETKSAKDIQEAKPGDFETKPVWQRFLVMFGGVFMNFVTALFLYCMLLFVWGKDVLPMKNIERGFAFNKSAQKLGFHNGDIPFIIDGDTIDGYAGTIIRDISNAKTVTVLRDGRLVDIQMPEDGLNMLDMIEMQPPFMQAVCPLIIDSVIPGSAADKVGLTTESKIVAVDETPVSLWSDYDSLVIRRNDVLSAETCTKKDSMELRNLSVVVETGIDSLGNATLDTLHMVLDKDYMMGVVRHNAADDYKIVHRSYTLPSCIPAGCSYAWEILGDYVNDLKYIPTKQGARSVGSFITIGSIFPSVWNWQRFWMLTAFISIILAVMNILPIPGLDGGHMVLLVVEGVTGHKPSPKTLERIEKVGMVILCLLMILAFGNDIVKWILPLFGL